MGSESTWTHDDQLHDYRLDLCYDGRNYEGFQSQPSQQTIQDKVEEALAQAAYLHGRLIGASRTDAGVSARQQVCLFRAWQVLDISRVMFSLNRMLPADIRVTRLESAYPGFHPLVSSVAKFYRYRLYCGPYLSSSDAHLYWHIHDQLILSTLARELEDMIGRHDFSAFAKHPIKVQTAVRHIFDIQIYSAGGVVEIWFYGEGFLRHMIRNLVGSAVIISCERQSRPLPQVREGCRHLKDILDSQDRSKAYLTAPPSPLGLMACAFDFHNLHTAFESQCHLHDHPDHRAVDLRRASQHIAQM